MREKSQLAEAYHKVTDNVAFRPRIGLILGSGLGVFAESLENQLAIPYRDIPHFPQVSIEGHQGNLVFGQVIGKDVVAMQGRVHFYEHGEMASVRFPVRLMHLMGVTNLIVTNACGGLRENQYPGALMLIKDHINFMGTNPLIGPNDDSLGPRFPDMSQPYDAGLTNIARSTAKDLNMDLLEGVYCAVSGPHYLSGAELKMLRIAGADTVGMSTVPEVIVANHCGIKVLGISCITDMAIPESLSPLTHHEVIEVAARTRPRFISFIQAIIAKLPTS